MQRVIRAVSAALRAVDAPRNPHTAPWPALPQVCVCGTADAPHSGPCRSPQPSHSSRSAHKSARVLARVHTRAVPETSAPHAGAGGRPNHRRRHGKRCAGAGAAPPALGAVPPARAWGRNLESFWRPPPGEYLCAHLVLEEGLEPRQLQVALLLIHGWPQDDHGLIPGGAASRASAQALGSGHGGIPPGASRAPRQPPVSTRRQSQSFCSAGTGRLSQRAAAAPRAGRRATARPPAASRAGTAQSESRSDAARPPAVLGRQLRVLNHNPVHRRHRELRTGAGRRPQVGPSLSSAPPAAIRTPSLSRPGPC